MAPNFKLWALLWLVAACLALQGTTADQTTTPKVTTTAGPTTTPTVTTTAGPTTTPKVTTTAGPTTTPKVTTTAGPTTTPKVTTTAGPTTTPKVTTTAGPTTTPKVTTTAGPTTTPKVTTTAGPTTTPKVTTTAGPTTTPKVTTTAGPTTTPKVTTTAGPTTTPKVTTTAGPTTTPKVTTTAGPTTTPTVTTTAGPTTTPTVTTTAGPTTTPTVTTTAPTKPGPCDSNPCGGGSTCAPRFDTFECLCLLGNFYNYSSSTCEGAKVFPGQLTLEKEYNDKYNDPTSEEFKGLSEDIVKELANVFKDTDGYSSSTVLKLKSSNTVRVWSRVTNNVLAEVENIFKNEAVIKATDVTQALTKAIQNSGTGTVLDGAAFKEEDLCIKNACDLSTTVCKDNKDGSFECECKEGYDKTDFSDRICSACPSGQKAGPSGCVNCPFGYSGLNCSESWKLVLVIVGSVMGALLLSSVIVIGVLARRPAKKSSKKKKDEETAKPYQSNFSTKAQLVNKSAGNGRAPLVNGSDNGRPLSGGLNGGAGVPRIPRAMTTSNMDHRTNLEMTPSNSRQNLVPTGRNARLYDDPDDINPYTQARPQNNPYAQNRPQNNPYSAKEGYSNPYYNNDNGRRLY